MTAFFVVKLLHVFSATILFGTGLGIAYFMWRAYRSGDATVLRSTAAQVVTADAMFTAPAAIVQIATGLYLVHAGPMAFASAWFVIVIGLYALVAVCWLPVVRIQIRVRDRLDAGATAPDCAALMSRWFRLGLIAFSAMVALITLMVFRGWFG